MLTGGHIAVSYLIAETPRLFELALPYKEIITVVIAGNIVDLDFLVGFINGKTGESHHQNLTHTPLGIFLIFLTFYLFFKPPLLLSILIILSMTFHLVLDDIGYWLYKFGFNKIKVNSQINWLFPFKSFSKNKMMTDNKKVLQFYLFKTWPIALLELIFIIIALIIFFI